MGRPKDLKERVILATECVSKYKLTIPMVIDGMEGKVNRDYQAAPVRVTVVDIEGNVAFYAGRGPADFRIPPVERTLKKLITNKGRMPPPPVPQWGEPVDGLRCGLSFDPEKLTLGEEVVIRITLQNTTDKPLVLRHDPADALGGIVITNGKGRRLRAAPLGAGRRPGPRRAVPREGRSSPLQKIEPGQVLASEVEARIMASSREPLPPTSRFRASLRLDISATTPAQDEPRPAGSIWTGRIASGVCTLQVISPP